MAKVKIADLSTISGAVASGDLLPFVDVSDTTDSAEGTTKKVTSANLLGAGINATVGTLVVNSTLGVTGLATFVNLTTTGTTTLGDSGDATTVNGTLGVTGNLTVDTDTLFVDAANNRVGIGTVAPSAKLHIDNPSYWGITPDFVTQGERAAIILYDDTTPAATASIRGIMNDDDKLQFSHNTYAADYGFAGKTTDMVIDVSGNVGIGTVSPQATLHVGAGTDASLVTAGTLIYASNAGTAGIIARDSTNDVEAGIRAASSGGIIGTHTNHDLFIRTNDATRMTILSGGNVGIGMSPNYQLELSTNSAAKPTSSAWTISSDLRLKDNITLADLDKCLAIVKDIPLKRFTWKDDVYSVEQVSDRSKIGFIANDVQLVFPKAVKSNKFTKVKIEDGFELVEEDVFIETETEIEKKEIKLVNGKYKEVITKEVQKNKEQVFDEFDLFDEAGEVIGKHKVAKKQTVSKPKFKQDVIEDCLSLDVDQINMALYGAVQLLIQKVEALEAK